jgi:hypothetical protein
MSANTKKYVYGAIVIILWLTTEVIIKNSDVMIGGIPYAAIMMFWLFLFCKAIGRTFWGFKKIEDVAESVVSEKETLMYVYRINSTEDGKYQYRGNDYDTYEDALKVARELHGVTTNQ